MSYDSATRAHRDGPSRGRGEEGHPRQRRAQGTSRRSWLRGRDAGESKKTVYVAIAANGLIAAAKFFGGVVSGSVAMLAEGAHSTVQTGNQVMLLLSLGMGGREPRASRPFGHGKERSSGPSWSA